MLNGFDMDAYFKQQEAKQSKMTLQKEDIFCVDSKYVVASCDHGGFNKAKARSNQKCPIFKNYIPFKSCTIKCKEEELDDVIYWSEWVMGGDCISKHKELGQGVHAIQIDYQCW